MSDWLMGYNTIHVDCDGTLHVKLEMSLSWYPENSFPHTEYKLSLLWID